MKILLGFEVGTGEAVYIDPDHLLETGLTQQSGKTTALNALISRSKRRAIAFRTKRGEIDWVVAKHLQPFYTQPKQRGGFIDWEYVESILEAHLGERVKFERRWIMQVCESAESLKEVYANSLRLEKESKHFFDKGQFYLLSNYFEKILPQLESREWATTLPLVEGVNLMDLEDMSFEMQCLVIERVMDYVLTSMKNVIIVLPEARVFIPLSAKTPVTKTAVKMASEGAVLEVDLWVDSQTYSSINSEVRKQCGTQLHGVQMDNNEAKTITDLLDKKWKPRKLKSLKLGHFFVKTKDKRYKHVYVLPAGIEEDVGIAVATGKLRVEEVKSMLMDLAPPEVVPNTLEIQDNELELLEAEGIVARNKEAIVRILAKLRTELDEANRKVLDLEEKVHRLEVDHSNEKRELEIRVEDLEREKEKLQTEYGLILNIGNDLATKIEPYENLTSALKLILQREGFTMEPEGFLEIPETIIDPQQIRRIVKEEIAKLNPRQQEKLTDGTGIPWVDMWLPKLKTPMQKKIVKLLADRIGVPLTKDQLALATGYSMRSGTFNQALRDLDTKYRLIKVENGKYSIAEGPP